MEIEKGTAQIEIVGPFGSVFLYTEKGRGIIGSLHAALSKKQSWNDPDFLSRIIFCEMVPRDEWENTSGFGIGTEMYANIDIFISIDSTNQEVSIQARDAGLQDKFKMSFDEFITSFTSSAQL